MFTLPHEHGCEMVGVCESEVVLQVVVHSDQGSGLIKGINDALPKAYQRRCIIHIRRYACVLRSSKPAGKCQVWEKHLKTCAQRRGRADEREEMVIHDTTPVVQAVQE